MCDNNSNKTARDPVYKVPALPPLQPDTTSQVKYLTNLFGVDNDDDEDKVSKVPQTPTIGGTANYHTLVWNTPWVNDDIKNEKVFTPFAITVYCLFFSYTYNVTSDIDLATITAAC